MTSGILAVFVHQAASADGARTDVHLCRGVQACKAHPDRHRRIGAGRKAVAHALALAKAVEARVTAVTVTDIYPTGAYSPIPMPSMIERYEAAAAENASKILASVSVAAGKLGITCETMHIKDQMPAEGIVAAAGEAACDLIVMASHRRRGVARMLLGSQAQKVVTLSPVSVLVCR